MNIDKEIVNIVHDRIKKYGYPPKPPLGDVQSRRDRSQFVLKAGLVAACTFYSDVDVKDFYASAPDGHQILLRWYTKRGSDLGSAVLYVHGGGMIVGEARWCDNKLSQYVSLSGVPMLSVEYRLAPENPYPVPMTDVYAGLKWLHENAKELGVDSDRIGIAGDSAGGGLAAACCLWALNEGGPSIRKQFLLYPMLDDRNIHRTGPRAPFDLWSNVDNETGWTAYLGDMRGTDDVPDTAAPARMNAQTAIVMPPLYIDVGDIDIFAQESIEYAMKHLNADVGVELHVRPGCIHGYEIAAPQSEVTRRSIADRVRAFQSL
jgi:acetyl esterase/lipase